MVDIQKMGVYLDCSDMLLSLGNNMQDTFKPQNSNSCNIATMKMEILIHGIL